MLSLPPSVRIHVARDPADMRKSFQGLAALVSSVIRGDPRSGHLFVFRNRRSDLVKVLFWDRSGFVLIAKRLERGSFHFLDAASLAHESFEIQAGELLLILEGLDLAGAKKRWKEPRIA